MSDTDDPEEGYAWGFARQEQELPAEDYRSHMHLLDEIEEGDLDALDLSGASDYILWAAAQAFEELDRYEDAIALLRRIAASASPHPALDYPDILLRLGERLKERGDYGEAARMIDQAERLDPDLCSRCDERRAEILVLRGRVDEGLDLFRRTAGAFPDDPWVPLRAAWALLASGRYDEIPRFIDRCEKALKDVEDEAEARLAADEIDRLRAEAGARAARRGRPAAGGEGGSAGLEAVREEILAALDAEEARLTGSPPRSGDARARATDRLAALHARASRAWDDAVEAGQEDFIAAFDDLQWDVVGLAERFGIELPGIDD